MDCVENPMIACFTGAMVNVYQNWNHAIILVWILNTQYLEANAEI